MRRDEGAALVVALLAMVLLTALGLGLMLLADTERLVAANYQRSVETLYAADALLGRTIGGLRWAPNWNAVLAGTAPSGFADSTRTPRLPSGVTINLDTVTVDIQTQSDAMGPAGANRPVWRLLSWGPLPGLLGLGSVASGQYGAVWVADDRFDVDGTAAADSNDVVALHAEAYGWAGARRIVEAVVGRVQAACEPGGSYWLASLRPTGTMRVFRPRVPGLVDLQNCAHSSQPAAPKLLSWREVR